MINKVIAKSNIIDKAIGFFSPKAGLNRIKHRSQYEMAASLGGSNYGYVVGGSNRKSMESYNPSIQSADADILPKIDPLIAASRDMYMCNSVATAIVDRSTTNVIGSGLTFQSQIDYETLSISAEEAKKIERLIEREFFTFANNPIFCDAAGELRLSDLAKLAYSTMLLSGDCFAVLPYIKRVGQPYNLKIKLLEGDICRNPAFKPDTGRCAGGIEIDDNGMPITFHFVKRDLNAFINLESYISSLSTQAINRFSKDGGVQVLHLYRKKRPGQRRGVPLLAPVIEDLKQLTRLSKAELDAAVLNAFFTVFVKSEGAQSGNILDSGFIPSSGDDTGTAGVQSTDPNSDKDALIYEMGRGNVLEMDEGQSVEIADPKRPNKQFEPFFNAIVRQIGAAVGQPAEIIMLYFNSSYSASRAAIQEAWKTYTDDRVYMANYFYYPILVELLSEAVLSGRLDLKGFFDDATLRDAWCSCTWTGRGQGQLDPLKETKASALAVQYRISTYEKEYAKAHGEDFERGMSRLARNKDYMKKLDILPVAEEPLSAEVNPSSETSGGNN